MNRFLHFSHRSQASTLEKPGFKPLIVAIILGLFLVFQVVLVLWVFLKQWRS